MSKKDLEEQIIYTEKNLQQEIILMNQPKIEETIGEKGTELDSKVSVPAPKRKENLRRFFK